MDIIGPVVGRGSQKEVSDNTKISLRRTLSAYTFGYLQKTG